MGFGMVAPKFEGGKGIWGENEIQEEIMGIKELVPTEDRLLVKRIQSDKTVGKEKLIIIPEDRAPKSCVAEVLEIGPGRTSPKTGKLIPIVDIIVGDLVLIGEYSGTQVEVNGDDCLLIREEEILGRVDWEME